MCKSVYNINDYMLYYLYNIGKSCINLNNYKYVNITCDLHIH